MSGRFLERGGLWVVVQGVLLLAVIVCALVWHNQWQSFPVMLFGALLLLAAAACGIAGALALGRNLTPFPQPSRPTPLVRSGIYGWMRHPLYTAVICASIGWALVWQSWPALMAAMALGPFLDAKARREERWLKRRFPDYARYEEHVRRFLPWVY